MRLWKPTIQSFFGFLAGPKVSTREIEDAIGDVRASMLAALGEVGVNSMQSLARRIQSARDVQALWYLRGDLMAALAALQGEQRARAIVREISAEFEGLLPGGMSTRPSPLGD